ncbi:ABC transporter substrate-binding protein [Inediibacterium massiliense]|uniref:ABC transporter substrate-binding protein n=1 Tax=Inediibacterium massiliense TaxID=1658111 RepID=UPI0006B5AD3A|nr:ABC transporter substrate-binding protein [Inediibacterium massiliense]
MKVYKKGMLFGLVFLLIFSMFMGCTQNKKPENIEENVKAPTKYPLEIKDGEGKNLVIEKEPQKIVSLSPSHTEILYGLGLKDKIVGVTNYCDYPKEATQKPKVGDAFNLNVEKIIELQPDMVFNYWPMKEEMKKKLDEAGIAVVTYAPKSISEIKDAIAGIGNITNKEKLSDKMVADIDNKKKEIEEKVKNAPKPKVFYEIEYSQALWTAGDGSFIDELITIGGGENVAKDVKEPYAQYSIESLVQKNPEIYITNNSNMQVSKASDIKQRPGFENINAIQNNRIKILDGNLLSRPSQRVKNAIEEMAKAIHPELF